MADAPTQFSTISTDAPSVYIAARQYTLAEKQRLLGEWGSPYPLPQRNSKTLRVDRWQRFNLPRATLTEGTAPDAVAMALDYQDVVVEQWGIVALITDMAEITVKHSPLQGAIDRTGLAISEVDEREIAETLLAGTNVCYGKSSGNTPTSRATIQSTDYCTTAVVLSCTTGLRSRGAMAFEGGLYGGVMATQIEGDLLSSDTTFQNASNFARVRKLEVGEIGIWMGVQWQRSNFLPIFVGVGAPGTKSATVTGFSETGTGSEIGSSKITVVAKEVTSYYERKISQEKSVGASSTTVTLTTPTSTNYVYDIYATNTSGTAYKLLWSDVAADTAKTYNAAAYTAGTSATPPSAPASGIEVFTAFIFGKDGYGRVTLDGQSVQAYLTPPGASYSNPLAQGRKVGSKVARKPFIIDGAFFDRIEAASRFSSGLPA